MKKRILTVVVVITIILLAGYLLIGNPVTRYNGFCLKKEIKEISKEEVTLNEIVPFE